MDKSHGYASPTASFTAKKQTHTVSTQSSRTNPSSAQKTLPHAVPLVRQQLKGRAFRQQQQELSKARGSQAQENNTHAMLRNGSATVVKGILIPFIQMYRNV